MLPNWWNLVLCVFGGEERAHVFESVWYTQLLWPKRREEWLLMCGLWQNLNDLLQPFIEIFLESHRDKFNRKCDNQHDHKANDTKRAHQAFWSSTQWIQVLMLYPRQEQIWNMSIVSLEWMDLKPWVRNSCIIWPWLYSLMMHFSPILSDVICFGVGKSCSSFIEMSESPFVKFLFGFQSDLVRN